MQMVEVGGVSLELDAEDLAEALELNRIKPMGEWVMATCPYHGDGKEQHQSFGINRESGIYHCFTCHRAGSVIKLTAEQMFGGDEAAAVSWLKQRYAVPELEKRQALKVTFPRTVAAAPTLPESALDPFRFRTQYVFKRGLTEEIAQYFDLGFNRETQSLTIPWRDRWGRLVFIKERPILRKSFRNDKGAHKGLYLFALWAARDHQAKEAFLVESEICSMYLWQHGRPAVAVGNNWLTEEQIAELLRVPSIEKIILMLDQDEAGRIGTERAVKALRGKRRLDKAIYPRLNAKDPNELSTDEIQSLQTIPIL